MSAAVRWLSVPALWLACAIVPATAQVPGDPVSDATGIVTSQAITVAGREFSDYFIAAWRDKQDSDRYTLAIHERPSARSGSQVWIEFGHRRVFQMQLPAARAALKGRAEQAAESTWQAVLEADGQSRLINDADLARDEI
ncbi:CsgE family curli-type amyloid fiber assembly protein [Massilia sp. R2A-15]|uniref:CsgE family curli-type amyloid fiber assembly protein n=1 Tax=Massilia sp. R2A-15 TaxID=3064278 RepID=UPI0027365494|nr:CsgE family curli-type amyloid fiber assembly protein [Massilia sp. R2A-15]WLI91413.1 CsgE family curli-type amyloid fiber assembly protein [Massilia sp. R2A-15]